MPPDSSSDEANRSSDSKLSSDSKRSSKAGLRTSTRGANSLPLLARKLLTPTTRCVIITGAGLSVASGIQTFRGTTDSIWKGEIWRNATRKAFRSDGLGWWNDFWLCYFPLNFEGYEPNDGHEAIARIVRIVERARNGSKVSVLTVCRPSTWGIIRGERRG